MAAGNPASTVLIEKLKGVENYNTWKFVMKMVLIHEELWDLVDNEVDSTKPEDIKKGQKALARIALSVQPTVFSHIRNASSAHAAWVNLQNAYEDKGLCRRLGLLRTLFSTKLQDCGDMQKYIDKIKDLAQQLFDIGAGLEDDFIAVLMLSGLTQDLSAGIIEIDSREDLPELIIDLEDLQGGTTPPAKRRTADAAAAAATNTVGDTTATSADTLIASPYPFNTGYTPASPPPAVFGLHHYQEGQYQRIYNCPHDPLYCTSWACLHTNYIE